MVTPVKICGIKTPEALRAACDNGARYIGLVFYPPSPRAISFDTAWNLARAVPTGIRSVGLFVDPDDDDLARIVTGIQLDMIQLHGSETPGRVAEIKSRYRLPVIKAIPVAEKDDLDTVKGYEAAADILMFDAKAPAGEQSGGHGAAFDWHMLAAYLADNPLEKPWFLAGGLTKDNAAQALEKFSALDNPPALDVSSGVEKSRGEKDPAMIKAFMDEIKTL